MTEPHVLLFSNLMVMTMKVTIFIVGYLTVRLGYNLLLAGVKGEFKFSASFGGSKADLASVSPGLLFVLLGVLLIGYALTVDKPYKMISSEAPRNSIPTEMIPTAPNPFQEMNMVPGGGNEISGKQ